MDIVHSLPAIEITLLKHASIWDQLPRAVTRWYKFATHTIFMMHVSCVKSVDFHIFHLKHPLYPSLAA